MQSSRFDKTTKGAPPAKGVAPAARSTDPNRYLRELNEYQLDAEGGERKSIPEVKRPVMESELAVVLDLYPADLADKRRRDGAKMESLLHTVTTTQREYALAADDLDVRRGGFVGAVFEGALGLVIFAFDWVLLTMSFFILFSSITESWRPAPEVGLVGGIAVFFALLAAALVKQLAKYAAIYNWARFIYILPWAGAAFGDLYFLGKQGKLNVGLIMTGFLAGLGGATYFHAKHHREQSRPRKGRKELLLDYEEKYNLFSKHYFLWQYNLDQMGAEPATGRGSEPSLRPRSTS